MLFRFRKAKAVRAGIVAPSHLLLKFGKLTTKFEVLCKETESPQLQNFVGEARDTRGGTCCLACGGAREEIEKGDSRQGQVRRARVDAGRGA